MEEQLKKALEDLGQIKAEFDKANVALLERVKTQDEEIKKHGGTMSETSTAIKSLEEQSQKLAGDFNGLKQQIEAVQKEMQRVPGEGGAQPTQIKTLGQILIESEEFKSWQGGGRNPVGCSRVGLKSFWPEEKKDVTGASDLRTVFATERLLEIFAAPLRKQRVRDLFTVIPTTMGSIQFIKETGYTNAAAIVAEGAAKPESALVFAEETTAIRTIAHHIPIARQLVEDVPALQAYINQRLIEGLKIKEDQQLLFGDGTGSNILGVMQDPDIATYTAGAGESFIDSVRKAATKVRLAEYQATGVVLGAVIWVLLVGTIGYHVIEGWPFFGRLVTSSNSG